MSWFVRNKIDLRSAAGAALIALAGTAWAVAGFLLSRIRDFDDFWHLWSGRLIAETGRIARIDPACFTTAQLDWINLNWLAQLAAYRLYSHFGLFGPIFLSSLLVLTVILCHLILIERRRPSWIIALISSAFLIFILHSGFSTRPQIASFALLALLNLLLENEEDPLRLRLRTAGFVTLLLIFWENIHGGVLFGLILIVSDGAAAFAASWRQKAGLLPQRLAVQLAVLALALGGYVFHPHGFAALHHTLTYSASMKPEIYQRITELQPAALNTQEGIGFAALILLTVLLCVFVRKLPPLRILIFSVTFFCLAAAVRRFIPPLVIVLLPAAVGLWQQLALRYPQASGVRRGRFGIEAVFGLMLAFSFLAGGVVLLPFRTPQTVPGAISPGLTDPAMYPVELVGQMVDQRISGNIFNEYGIGGYLGWIFYRQGRIFIDGRGDLHSPGGAFDRYAAIVEAAPGWEQELELSGADLVLFPSSSELIERLSRLPNWKKRLADRYFTLLEKSGLPVRAD